MIVCLCMSSEETGLDGEEGEENSVIEWSEKVEDHTLAVLEGDIEDDPASDLDDLTDLDGDQGVAKNNNLPYVTDFEAEFDFEGAKVEVSVERSGGLNTIEYWSEDPHVMAAFRNYIEERMKTVEQQPLLEAYKFEDVKSNEVQELIQVYENEFEIEGPLPRGSNGHPRMHMVRVEDMEQNDYEQSDEEAERINATDQIPGDAKYVIDGLANPGEFDVEGVLEIRPQKHDTGLYTVKVDGDGDADSQAYMINTSLRVLDPERDEFLEM